ncbi:tetratricopeptide repeat protein, partial [Pseudomonadota bacterium]
MSSQRKKIISFSLWGSLPLYNVGAVKNAELAKTIYPGWLCRYYVASDVEPSTIARLRRFDHVEVVEMGQPGSHAAACWRFVALDDNDVEIAIFRDLDSRLTPREKAAVDEWLGGSRSFHIMRDSPLQHAAINAGAWGGRAKIPGGLRAHLDLYLINNQTRDFGYSLDQKFLGEIIYPIIAPDTLVHDEFHQGNPFPISSVEGEFIGEKIMPDGSPDPVARAFTQDCRKNPSKSIAVYYLRYGNRLRQVPERHAEALACYRRAIAIEDRLIPAHINLGNLLHRIGKTSEAEQAYREALARDPKTAEGYANLGAIQINRGQLKKAERLIQ